MRERAEDPERTACALRAAEAGAEVAAASFRGDVAIETKAEKTDVVTQIDRDAQERIVSVIREAYPDDVVVGEEDEEAGTVPDDGPSWIVDPIDGTNNYVRGSRLWTTSVAATVDGEAVAGATVCPALGDTYLFDGEDATLNGEPMSVSERTDPETFTVALAIWWGFDRRDEYLASCRGIIDRFGDMRRTGSTQLELAMCAAGAVEGVVTNVEANPWDTVVGMALVEAAGGQVTDIEGDPWRHDSRGIVASNGEAHDAVLAAAREGELAR